MNSEENRLKTFSNWPKNAPVSSYKIAKAGFFYTGYFLEVQCHFCNKVIKSWSYADQVMLKHRKLNPDCSFVVDPLNSGNIPYNPRIQKSLNKDSSEEAENLLNNTSNKIIMNDGINRLRSFLSDGIFLSVQMYHLSINGFYALGCKDSIVCSNCSFGLKDWIGSLNPITEHSLCKPECSMTQRNFLISEDEFSIDKSPDAFEEDLREFQKRFNTFTDWPHESPDPKSLSFAGLYFTNEEDFVRCYYCDIGLRHWLKTDNPLVEHARSSPTCKFIISLTSEFFVKMCVQHFQNNSSNVSKLEAEIRDLRESKLCKICLDEDIAIAFVPCGHLLSCQRCAVGLDHCPLCRGRVFSTVRTYLS